MDTSHKLTTREELLEVIITLEKDKKITGFTSGAFDILHAGHVDYLEKARSQCDVLIVAVNSDQSIKEYKSEKRPIISQDKRARIISGLSCVDYVFIFEELNNNKNIEILKPKIYFKAADYNKKKLSSAPIIEAYGGKVSLIELTPENSTTSVIDEILLRYNSVFTEAEAEAAKERKPAIFLDRDGTINEHVDYLHDTKQFKIIPGAIEAMKKLQDAGYRLVITTNQPGIGLGYFTKENLYQVNKELFKACSELNVNIDKIYYCPHSKAEGCNCRKPATGMIDRAVKELNIDLENSYMIGDTTIDMKFGNNAGVKTILVETGYGGHDALFDGSFGYKATDLKNAADYILNKMKAKK